LYSAKLKSSDALYLSALPVYYLLTYLFIMLINITILPVLFMRSQSCSGFVLQGIGLENSADNVSAKYIPSYWYILKVSKKIRIQHCEQWRYSTNPRTHNFGS